jgi:glycosyltransferase involved in cell wall biosynthesis
MKLLAIASSGDLGGAELSLITFLEHRPADVEPTVLVAGDGPLTQRLAARGIPTWSAPDLTDRSVPRAGVSFGRRLERLLRTTRPDVAWAVGQRAALLAALTCRRRSVPMVWHKVDLYRDRPVAKPLAAVVNAVVTPSRAAAEALGPLRTRRLIAVVAPPVRLPPQIAQPRRQTPPTIGTLARLVPYKGHHLILRAAALLSHEFPEMRVVLAGGPAPTHPDYPAALKDLPEALGLSGRVEFPGFVTEVLPVLGRLDVFVNATHRDSRGYGPEGLSQSMTEASWVGLPVVATDAGGTREGLVDGVTGTLVRSANPDALARAIAPYLRDERLAQRTGEAGRALARKRFAPEATARLLFSALGRAALVERTARIEADGGSDPSSPATPL